MQKIKHAPGADKLSKKKQYLCAFSIPLSIRKHTQSPSKQPVLNNRVYHLILFISCFVLFFTFCGCFDVSWILFYNWFILKALILNCVSKHSVFTFWLQQKQLKAHWERSLNLNFVCLLKGHILFFINSTCRVLRWWFGIWRYFLLDFLSAIEVNCQMRDITESH